MAGQGKTPYKARMTASLPTHDALAAAREIVYRDMSPTPQYAWPLLAEKCGCEVRVKHENHTPIGAFKLRGGLVFMQRLKQRMPDCPGVISATRGNHGQSIGYAARRAGLNAVIVVPHGNSTEKNAAMRALGVELIETGDDFTEAAGEAEEIAAARGLSFVPSFHEDLVAGVGTYGMELFEAAPDLDVVYVPIGLGSGICGTMAAKAALGCTAEVVGVVAERAAGYALSFAKGEPVATNTADTFADGMAVRAPNADAVALICAHAARVITVSEDEIAAAMRAYFTCTHNLAEGAGAAPLAALMQERERYAGKKAGVILSGGNIDRNLYLMKLAG
jgi:threonine dehydratase